MHHWGWLFPRSPFIMIGLTSMARVVWLVRLAGTRTSLSPELLLGWCWYLLYFSSGYSAGAAGLPGAGAGGAGGGGASSELTASSSLAPSLAPHSRPGQFQPASSPLTSTSTPAATILPPTPMVRPPSPPLTWPDLTWPLSVSDEGCPQAGRPRLFILPGRTGGRLRLPPVLSVLLAAVPGLRQPGGSDQGEREGGSRGWE